MFKTPFINLYEEMSRLYESSVGENTTTTVTQAEIDTYLEEVAFTAFYNAMPAHLRKFIKGTSLVLKGTADQVASMRFFSPNPRSKQYRFKWCYGSLLPAVRDRETYNRSDDTLFDITGGWLCFYFIQPNIAQNSPTIQTISTELSTQITQAFNRPLSWELSDTYITELPSNFVSVGVGARICGVCVKVDSSATTATLSLAQSISAYDPKNQQRLSIAREFVQDFEENGYRIAHTLPSLSALNNYSQLKHIALHVEDLVDYWANTDIAKRNNMETMLNLMGVDIRRGKKSLQYLYNAMNQETIIENSGIARNPNASRVPTAPRGEEYKYLMTPNSVVGKLTAEPDFIYLNTWLVDAKIYKDEQKMWSYATNGSSTHYSNFLIVYLKNKCSWKLLYRRDPKEAFKDWEVDPDENFIEATKLAKIIAGYPSFELLSL